MAVILKQATATALALLLAAVLFTTYSAQRAQADHEPANKVAAAGSDIDTVGNDSIILQERLKVSSPFDLILQLTAECSILTALTTNNDNPTSTAEGSVRMRIEIDGNPVPVSSDDLAGSTGGADDAADDDDEVGEVTFCNRAYSRTVTDNETALDGVDEEDDFIRTRTANAFNWLALNVGETYDSPANGNNIVDIVVFADYDTDTVGEATAEAFVGSRTLIAEPTNASVHETVDPADADGGN